MKADWTYKLQFDSFDLMSILIVKMRILIKSNFPFIVMIIIVFRTVKIKDTAIVHIPNAHHKRFKFDEQSLIANFHY